MISLTDIKLPFPMIFRKCLKIPSLQSGEAVKYADNLMERLDKEKSADIDTEACKRDPAFSTDYLFSNAGGQMLGILVCINRKGEKIILKAFSGQYNSRWIIPGWVPPVIDPADFDKAVKEKDKEIKKLESEIKELESAKKAAAEKNTGTAESMKEDWKDNKPDYNHEDLLQQIKNLKKRRKKISRSLMKEIHSLYFLNNFAGEKRLMSAVFLRNSEIQKQKTAEVFKEKNGVRTALKKDAKRHSPDRAAFSMNRKRPSEKGGGPPAVEKVCRYQENSEPEKIKKADHTADTVSGLPASGRIGMPSGTGDCCAPKLLNYAAKVVIPLLKTILKINNYERKIVEKK